MTKPSNSAMETSRASSPGNQLSSTLSDRDFTEIVAEKVTDKIVSLLVVTDEIRAGACKEIVAEIVESLGRKRGQKQENLQAMTGQKARAEKAPDCHHQEVLTEEANGIETADVSQTFWSSTYSKGKYKIM